MAIYKYRYLPLLIFLSAGSASAQTIGLCGVGETTIKGDATLENTLTLSGFQNLEEAYGDGVPGAFETTAAFTCEGVCTGVGELLEKLK